MVNVCGKMVEQWSQVTSVVTIVVCERNTITVSSDELLEMYDRWGEYGGAMVSVAGSEVVVVDADLNVAGNLSS